jgi:hypothetical protein
MWATAASDAPARAHAVRPLQLDGCGRLTLTTAVRRRLGLADGADVAFTIDPGRGLLTATAASRLDGAVAAAFEMLREAPAAPGSGRPGPRRHLRLATGTSQPARPTTTPTKERDR